MRGGDALSVHGDAARRSDRDQVVGRGREGAHGQRLPRDLSHTRRVRDARVRGHAEERGVKADDPAVRKGVGDRRGAGQVRRKHLRRRRDDDAEAVSIRVRKDAAHERDQGAQFSCAQAHVCDAVVGARRRLQDAQRAARARECSGDDEDLFAQFDDDQKGCGAIARRGVKIGIEYTIRYPKSRKIRQTVHILHHFMQNTNKFDLCIDSRYNS